MKRFSSLLIVALLVIFSNSAWALVIGGDRTGGDCGYIGGIWNGRTNTCTLTRDINASDYTTTNLNYWGSSYNPWYSLIDIEGSGTTLDGHG